MATRRVRGQQGGEPRAGPRSCQRSRVQRGRVDDVRRQPDLLRGGNRLAERDAHPPDARLRLHAHHAQGGGRLGRRQRASHPRSSPADPQLPRQHGPLRVQVGHRRLDAAVAHVALPAVPRPTHDGHTGRQRRRQRPHLPVEGRRDGAPRGGHSVLGVRPRGVPHQLRQALPLPGADRGAVPGPPADGRDVGRHLRKQPGRLPVRDPDDIHQARVPGGAAAELPPHYAGAAARVRPARGRATVRPGR